MSWVFLALVFMIVSLLVRFLRQIMDSVSKNRYYPPSDAIIDQVLPEEVFEHVISFSDPLTLLRCQSVSKYWHYNASKLHIKSEVLQNAINEVQNLPDIKTSILSDPEKWMKYPANYPVERRLSDFALAQKRDKYLLEIDDQASMSSISQSHDIQKYIVKMRGKVLQYPTFNFPAIGNVHLNKGSENFQSVVINNYNSAEQYEVLALLEECVHWSAQRELLMCRAVNPVKQFGFIVLDNSFLKVMSLLFVPLIVHDVLYSESFMNILKQWFGTVVYLSLITWVYFANMRIGHGYPNSGFFKKMTVITLITTFIAFIAFYPHSADHYAFVSIFIAMFAYGFAVVDHAFENVYHGGHGSTMRIKDSNSFKLFITVLALLVFMNDWKMVYQSILDRVLFHRLLKNTVHYVIFLVYCIWNNSLLQVRYSQEKWQVFGRYLLDWDRTVVKLMVNFYGCVVLATLYAPYWQGA